MTLAAVRDSISGNERAVVSGAGGLAVGALVVAASNSTVLTPVLTLVGVLAVAILTALFAEGRQVRQLEHDRVLADRGELRDALVAGALAMQGAGYVAHWAQQALLDHGPYVQERSGDLPDELRTAGRALDEAQIRIALQLGEDHAATDSITTANRDHFAAVYRAVRSTFPGSSDDVGETYKAVDQHVSALAYLQRRLQCEATKLVGASTAALGVSATGPDLAEPEGQS